MPRSGCSTVHGAKGLICTFSKPNNSPQTPQNGHSQISQSAPASPDQDSTSNNF